MGLGWDRISGMGGRPNREAPASENGYASRVMARILVVEDERDLNDLIARQLRQ